MLSLENSQLAVQLLDPADPKTRILQGTRYCWGGYIWQVRDGAGDLLSGPEYPDQAPIPFNGQGLPESFRLVERATNRLLTGQGDRGFVIGVGEVALGASNSIGLIEPAVWQTRAGKDRCVFSTRQGFGDWTVELVRTVVLRDRTLDSLTELANVGRAALPLQWFAHPFLPLVNGLTSGRVPPGFGLPPNPTYTLRDGAFETIARAEQVRGAARFQLLEVAPVPLDATFTHPRLSHVRITADFVASEVPVWSNDRTFSIEPYLTATVAPGETRRWSMRYEFGR